MFCGLRVQTSPRSALKRAGVWRTGPPSSLRGCVGSEGAGACGSDPHCLPAAWPGQDLAADLSHHPSKGSQGAREALPLLVWDMEHGPGS